MALTRLLEACLLLLLIHGACCFSTTSHLRLLLGRKLARHVAASDIEDKPILEQLLARKAQIADHVNSEAFKSRLQQQRQHFRSNPSQKQGILIVAGGRDMFANAAITIMTLRRQLQCQLPVEIIHFGPGELPASELLSLLQSLNTTSSNSSSADAAGHLYITDALSSPAMSILGVHHKQLKEWKGFPAKAFALAFATRFQQVMLLDADSMPLVDPALLLDTPTFQKHGNLFWPDFWWNAWVNSTIYDIAAGMKQAPWEGNQKFRLVDSGQMLFDRLRHADVLEYLWLLNSHHEWVYKHMHGDKDTFLLAFAMAGKLKQFKQVQTYVRDAMTDQKDHKHRWHHLGMVQSIPFKLLASGIAKSLTGNAGSRAAEAAAKLLVNYTGSSSNGVSRGSDSAVNGAAAGRDVFKSVRLDRELLQHVGLPVVFHRTSFNSKFFPDCLDQNKVKNKYCEVQYVSVPLSSEQAGYSLKPNMFAFNDDQISLDFYYKQCRALNSTAAAAATSPAAPAASTVLTTAVPSPGRRRLQRPIRHRRRQRQSSADSGDSYEVSRSGLTRTGLQRMIADSVGLPLEWGCDKLTVGDKEMPIPVMPVQLFGHMLGVLQYSYEAFREVREKVKV